jgi:hypothetical protein
MEICRRVFRLLFRNDLGRDKIFNPALAFTISEQPMTMSMMTRLMTNENDDRPAADDAVTIEEHNGRQKQEIENDVAPCNGRAGREEMKRLFERCITKHKRAVEGIVRRSRKRRRRGSAAR